MGFPDNITRDEAAARSQLLATDSYQVVVDLSGGELTEVETTFVSTSVVRFSATLRCRAVR